MTAAGRIAAFTVDTEYPSSWTGLLDVAARRGEGWVALARELDVPLTWMIKVSAQDKRSTAEYFFSRLAPLLPATHEVGLHVHFEDDQRKNPIRDPQARADLISGGAAVLRGFGVQPRVFRAGCLRAEDSDIPALDAEGLLVDSSTSPGSRGSADLADWRRATIHAPYHPATDNLAQRGHSRLVEVPIVSDGTGQDPLWLDTWQATAESMRILEAAFARGDRFLCLVGHDGSVDLDRVRSVVARLRSSGTSFATLSGLVEGWATLHKNGPVQSGKIAAGARLPSYREIAGALGIPASTVDIALRPLVKEGLLDRHHGSGTFVRERPPTLKTIGLYYLGGALAHPEFRYLRAVHRCLTDRIEASGRNWDVWNDPRPAEESGQPWPALVDAIQRGTIDAVVAAQIDTPHAEWLLKLPVPVAVVGWRQLRNSVYPDQSQLPRLAVEALARQGCRSLGLISAWPSRPLEPDHTDDVLVTFRTFVAEAQRHQLVTRESWIVTIADFWRPPTLSCEAWGYRAFMQLWDQPEHPDGLVVVNDAEALGVTMAILEKGVHVPEELRLAYHKNAEVDLFCPLPVTHVVGKADDAAAALLDLVQQQFEGKREVTAELGYTLVEPEEELC